MSATHLFYLVIFCMSGWAVLTSHLPSVLALPVGATLIFAGAALAWGRAGGRPLDRWAWLFFAYRARPRRGAEVSPPAGPVMRTATGSTDAAVADRVVQLSAAARARAPRGVGVPATRVERRARRCLFFSYRGGSGKSALAAETAALLSTTAAGAGRPLRVALLDLDVVSSTMGVRLGLTGPGVAELLGVPGNDYAVMESVLQRHESGARVLLAPLGGPATADAYSSLIPRISVLLAYLDSQGFDVIVIDTKGASGDLDGYLFEAVDDIYYVFSPTAPGICDLYRGVGALRRAGHRAKVRLVLNHADAAIDLREVYADLRLEPVAEIPSLPVIADAEDRHVPASLTDTFMAEALRDLVDSMCPDGGAARTPGWLDQASAGYAVAPFRM